MQHTELVLYPSHSNVANNNSYWTNPHLYCIPIDCGHTGSRVGQHARESASGRESQPLSETRQLRGKVHGFTPWTKQMTFKSCFTSTETIGSRCLVRGPHAWRWTGSTEGVNWRHWFSEHNYTYMYVLVRSSKAIQPNPVVSTRVQLFSQ